MDFCGYCGKELTDNQACDCWESLLYQNQTEKPSSASQTPEASLHSPKKDNGPAPAGVLWREIKTVLGETTGVLTIGEEKPSFVLSPLSSLVLLGVYLLVLVFFFGSVHSTLQKILGSDLPPSGMLALLPLISIAFHVLCNWGLLLLFQQQDRLFSSEDLLSITAANTSTWSIALLVVGVVTRLFSFSASLLLFLVGLLLAAAFLISALLFYGRLEGHYTNPRRQQWVVITCMALQTALTSMALLIFLLRLLDQLVATLFR